MTWLTLIQAKTYRKHSPLTRLTRLRLEPLEERRLLSTCHVTRLSDNGVGKGFRGDLRYCINKVNTEPGPDAIDFTMQGETIYLNSALPDLSTDIEILGPGKDRLWIARNGTPQSGPLLRIFKIAAGAKVQISGLSMLNGKTSGADADGAGIYNAGDLTIRDSLVGLGSAIASSSLRAGAGFSILAVCQPLALRSRTTRSPMCSAVATLCSAVEYTTKAFSRSTAALSSAIPQLIRIRSPATAAGLPISQMG